MYFLRLPDSKGRERPGSVVNKRESDRATKERSIVYLVDAFTSRPRVVDDEAEEKVRDDSDAPIPGASVSATDESHGGRSDTSAEQIGGFDRRPASLPDLYDVSKFILGRRAQC